MSDNLDTPPVTRIEGTRLIPPIKNSTTLNAIYKDQEIYNWGIHGPFNQTLFLGCSVVNFNVNLGWGAENSSLTVSLVNDDTPHWLGMSNSNIKLDQFDYNANHGVNTASPPAYNNPSIKTFNNNEPTPPATKLFTVQPGILTKADTVAVNQQPSSKRNETNDNKVVGFRDQSTTSPPDQGLHADLILHEQQNLKDNITTNTVLSTATPVRADFGKVYYQLNTDGSYTKKYWLKKDPGFVGEVFDILGTAVRFIFNDFEFVGIVTSWKNNGGQEGNKLYTVEIKSLATLLNNTQLIIDHYPGTIFSKLDDYPQGFNSISGFGLPSNDIGNRYGKLSSWNLQNTNTQYDAKHSGTICQGNLPNVFNIYGYLESTNRFGKNDINEEGTPINAILAAVNDLINFTKDDRSVQYMDKRFSPYGRIIGRAPAVTKRAGTSSISSINPNIVFLQDEYTIIQPQNCTMSGVALSGILDTNNNPTTSPPFTRQIIVKEPDIKLNELGLLPCYKAADGIIRQQYSLNLDKLPPVPSGSRIKGPIISIMDLVNKVCEDANYSFFIDFMAMGTGINDKALNQIAVRTIERKSQPPNNYIQQLIASASSGSILTSYDYGLELNDQANIRSVYIGAKQKRLLQVHSNFLSNKNNGLVYDPYEKEGDGRLINYDVNTILNAYRIPNHYSIRNTGYNYYKTLRDSSTNGYGTGAVIWEKPSDFTFGKNCGSGNYLYPIIYRGANLNSSAYEAIKNQQNDPNKKLYGDDNLDIFKDLGWVAYTSGIYLHTNNPIPRSFGKDIPDNQYYNYPLWDDFICPYFGLDIDGNARKVFFDPAMRQIQVLCSIGDLENLLGFALTSAISYEKTVITEWIKNKTVTAKNDNTQYNPNISRETQQLVNGAVITASQAADQSYQRNLIWNIDKREYYTYDAKFLLTENEIRAAMAGFDSWSEYTFNKTFTTDLGQILRKTIFSNTGQIVQEKTDSSETARINLGLDYAMVMIYDGPDCKLLNSPNAENPTTSKWGMITERVKKVLETAHQYVANIGNTYYGKQFMVKIPGLSISKDKPLEDITDIEISATTSRGTTINFNSGSYNGGGVYYSSYKPSTDGAWEEPGNFIDNTIVVGSISGDFFTEPDGKISTILGYKASYEFLKDTIPDEELNKLPQPAPDPNANQANINAGVTINRDDKPSTYTSQPPDVPKPVGETARTILKNTQDNQPTPGGQTENVSPVVPTAAMILSQVSQPATGTDIIPNEWYPSVITELSSNDYLFYPYSDKEVPIFENMISFANSGDIGRSVNGSGIPEADKIAKTKNLRYKLYTKAKIQDNYEYISCIGSNDALNTKILDNRPGGREPRAIISIDSAVNLNPVHLVDQYLIHCLTLDSILFKTEGCTLPPEIKSNNSVLIINGLILRWQDATNNGGYIPFSGGFGVGDTILTLATDHLVNSVNSSSRTNAADKANTMPIHPKAAMPGFAAVPLEHQGSVYGPWTNHPFLIRKDIFTDPDISNNPQYLKESIENLVGGLKVIVEEELAPWRYGGMRYLDEAVIAKIENDANYQLQIESGEINIPGSPIYRLGDFLDKTSKISGGPIINSIRSNIDKGGISTQYSVRTFSKKFGLYNKENADRLAKINTSNITNRRQLAILAANVSNKLSQSLKKQNINNAPTTQYTNPPMAASWRSASELLVGHNEISFRVPSDAKPAPGLNNVDIGGAMSGVLSKFKYDYSWGYHPICLVDPMKSGVYNVLDYPKFISHTRMMDSRESPKLLAGDYENTSFMSLDGLISPISFYPTENFRTYHITKYPRNSCRYCLGVGKIKYSTNSNTIAKFSNIKDIQDYKYNNIGKERIEINIDCPFCELDTDKVKKLTLGSSRGSVTPPFVLTKDSDTKTEAGSPGSKDDLTVYNTVGTVINYSTLNPVVLSFGEFSNFQNKQEKDFTGHCIKMVAQGTVPPNGPNDTFNNQFAPEDRLAKSYLEYDQLYLDKVLELTAIPEDKKTDNIKKILSNIQSPPRSFANNSRFFGLRGPMMLHGWGYDTEGYPVPNASGEFKYDEDNEEGKENKRKIIICKTLDGNKDFYVYKNQEFVEAAEGSDEAEGKILVSYEKSGVPKIGYWTDPFKETTFAMGWSQTPSIWPVGPIDLRWDERAKVWTMPSTYKNVYILLEEDLNNNIARGELIDNNQDSGDIMLALGYRKVVFVKDTLGIYKAPRSAVVYCAYDKDGGYYEPISQSSFTTSGTIISSTTAEIYKIYQKSASSLANNSDATSESRTYVASYTNPLDLNVSPGQLALFTYLNNGWIVQSARS